MRYAPPDSNGSLGGPLPVVTILAVNFLERGLCRFPVRCWRGSDWVVSVAVRAYPQRSVCRPEYRLTTSTSSSAELVYSVLAASLPLSISASPSALGPGWERRPAESVAVDLATIIVAVGFQPVRGVRRIANPARVWKSRHPVEVLTRSGFRWREAYAAMRWCRAWHACFRRLRLQSATFWLKGSGNPWPRLRRIPMRQRRLLYAPMPAGSLPDIPARPRQFQ